MPGKPKPAKRKTAKRKAARVSGRSRARKQAAAVRKPAATDVLAQLELPIQVASMGGRPTRYSDALGDRICMWIAGGMPIATSCMQEGIGRATFYDWKARAKVGEEPFATFFRAVDQALARSEVAVMQSVVAAARENWKAGAWWLERRFPKRYGQRQHVKLEKAPGEMTDAELDAAIAAHGYVRAPSPTDTGS